MIRCPICRRPTDDDVHGWCRPCHEAMVAQVRESRLAQGLPEKIEDPATIARIAAMMRAPTGRR